MLIFICPHCYNRVEDITTLEDGENRYYCEYCEIELGEDEVETNDTEEDDDFEDDEDDIPEGCAACGGPYPSCKKSCNVFDD